MKVPHRAFNQLLALEAFAEWRINFVVQFFLFFFYYSYEMLNRKYMKLKILLPITIFRLYTLNSFGFKWIEIT